MAAVWRRAAYLDMSPIIAAMSKTIAQIAISGPLIERPALRRFYRGVFGGLTINLPAGSFVGDTQPRTISYVFCGTLNDVSPCR